MACPPISATIITLNEEAHIEEAIRSVAFCSEVLVVDCGSTDRTVEMARALGARVLHNEWPGHVSQKNYAVDHAVHDWVLGIDADERVTPRLRDSIEAALTNPRHDAYTAARLNHYGGRWIRHSGWYPQRRVRLFRKDRARWGGIDPHDTVQVNGSVGQLDGDLLHYPYRNLAHHLDTINRYTTIAAQERMHRGQPAGWWRMVFEPPLIFLKKYLLQLGFLDGGPGFLIAASTAWYALAKHAKLRELYRTRRDAR